MVTTRYWAVLAAAILGFGVVANCSDDDNNHDPVCGNGVLEVGEGCDDGNTTSGDGCSATCQTEAVCGNGTREGTEECDDGNTTSGDGCSSTCTNEGNGCTSTSFTSIDAFVSFDGTTYSYDEGLTDTADSYVLFVELYPEFINGGAGGTLTTGDHPLGVGDEINYNNCAYCVYLARCTDAQCSDADAFFFATDGTLNLSALGTTEGAAFTGSLTDVTFTEWDLDLAVDEPIQDGECLDVAAHTLDATVVLD